MRSIRAALPKFAGAGSQPAPAGFPDAEVIVPTSVEEVAEALTWSSEHGATIVPWGGGTHQGFGNRPPADIVMDMSALDAVEAWVPDDLTVVVQAGKPIGELESMLSDHGQTALLAELPGSGTVGGSIAAGVSGYRRGRYGPTRDRLLEVTLVTGDGRVVRGGARVVKNVTGYDLPRLAVGSFGSLGVITSVCLKLWPAPATTATVTVDDAVGALGTAWRPLAVLETRESAQVFLGGTAAEVESQVAALGGEAAAGLAWPAPPSAASGAVWSLRVPVDLTTQAIEQIPTSSPFVAQHGVGEITWADAGGDIGVAVTIRGWAERHGGALVMVAGDEMVRDAIDPWGTPPSAMDIQRRLIATFDPDRVLNRGRLPGGL